MFYYLLWCPTCYIHPQVIEAWEALVIIKGELTLDITVDLWIYYMIRNRQIWHSISCNTITVAQVSHTPGAEHTLILLAQ
jgi:hypothetical protein